MGYRIAVVIAETEPSRAAGAQVRGALEAAGHEAQTLACGDGLATDLAAGRFDAAWDCSLDADGTATALAEALGIPHVGTAFAARRALEDAGALYAQVKAAQTREELDAAAPAAVALPAACLRDLGALEALPRIVDRIPGGYPVCAGAARGGLPVRRAENAAELEDALRALANAGTDTVVQEWVEGARLAVCVLGDADDLLVLPAVELADGGALHAPVRPESLAPDRAGAESARSEVERTALDAYLALGLRDLACLHLVWDGARARLLAVEAAPSFAPDAVMPHALAAAQVDAAEALGLLVEAAVERGAAL